MKEEQTVSTEVKDPGFWRELWQQARLVYYLMLDREVPIYLKIVPFLALGYFLLPFDFLPDVAPILGQVDDVTMMIIGAKVFIDLAPPQIVARHMRRIRERDGYLVTDESAETADPDVIEGIVIEQKDYSQAE